MLEWLGVAAVVLLIAGRPLVHRLPPDGALRTWVGPGIALMFWLFLTIRASVAGWQLWRGSDEDPYGRSILAKPVTDRLTLALPSMAIAGWGFFVGGLLSIVFVDDTGLRMTRGPAAVAVAVLVLVMAVVIVTFSAFAYTSSRWRWPRFVLPASERRRGEP